MSVTRPFRTAARTLSRSHNRAGRIRSGPGRGLRIGDEQASADYRSGGNELAVQHALVDELDDGAVLYDIGANVGFFSLISARAVGPTGVVYAFEPVPANVEALEANRARNDLPNLVVVPMAIGATTAVCTLYLDQHPGGATLSKADGSPGARHLEVPVVTVDDLVRSGACRPPDVVKIDVEGAEPAVLEGMSSTARARHPTIICEVDAATREGAERKAGVITDVLEGWGYRLHRLPDSYADYPWAVIHLLARR